MTDRDPRDLLPLRVALNDYRAVDTDFAMRTLIVERALAVVLAADGIVHEYLEVIRELEELEDEVTDARVERDEARCELDRVEAELEGLAHPDSDDESVALAVREEHDLCHEDPWIACRHACCREASRLVA